MFEARSGMSQKGVPNSMKSAWGEIGMGGIWMKAGLDKGERHVSARTERKNDPRDKYFLGGLILSYLTGSDCDCGRGQRPIPRACRQGSN